MDLTAIPDLRVESAGEEVTYRLPMRPLGALRILGLLPIGFTALWLGGVGSMLLPQLRHVMNQQAQGFDYFMAIFLLVFAAAGCVPAGLGLLILFGRCRIRWRDAHLTVIESVGPFGWPRRMPRKAIRKFLVAGGGLNGERAVIPGPLGAVGMLMAHFETGSPRVVAAGYPRPWLEAIAQDLSTRAGFSQSTTPPPVEVLDGTTKPSEDVIEKPLGSPVTLERRDASIVLNVPPPGLRKGSMGLFFFATLWCLFIAVFTGVILFTGNAKQPKDFSLFLILSIFWIVGFVMLGVSINLGRRRFTLTAGRSELTVVTDGPFGSKRFTFRGTDIATICTGASNVEVNHRTVLELQVQLRSGTKKGFMAGRDPDELRWMAAELRKALGVEGQNQPIPQGPFDPMYPAAAWQRRNSPVGGVLAILIFVGIGAAMFWHPISGFFRPAVASRPMMKPMTAYNPALKRKPAIHAPGLAFTAFGPSGSYGSNCWAVIREAHAEWFVAETSGHLTEIELAIESDLPGKRAGKATVFIAKDNHGFPGATLESFSVAGKSRAAGNSSETVTVDSIDEPMLDTGAKYWICARSPGGWKWHDNDQNVIQNSAREVKRGKWASAGDYSYVGAFAVRVATNQPVTPSPQPIEATTQNTNSP